MEVDARSVYIGRNISNHYTTTTHSSGNKVSQGCKIREMILLNWGGKIGLQKPNFFIQIDIFPHKKVWPGN